MRYPTRFRFRRLDVWSKNDSRPPFDYLFSYRDAYVGVIAEGIGLGTAQKICDLSKTNLASKASRYVTTTPVALDIDSHSWLTYDATATLTGVEVNNPRSKLRGISNSKLHLPFV